jgi:O-antigen ligase
MHYALAALLSFGILTLWAPAEWPVAGFEILVFALAGWAVFRSNRRPPILPYPFLPLCAAVAVGAFQLATGRTVYAFDTKQALLRWLTFLCVFFIASAAFRDERAWRWFRGALLWFATAVALLAILQTFTADGQIFWMFRVPYSDVALGPILSRNHFAAFVEAILPLALYQALRYTDWPYVYASMVAILYGAVVASASRAGTLLCTALVVIMIVVLYSRRMVAGRHAGMLLLRVVAVLTFFTLVVGWQSVWVRLTQPDPMRYRAELNAASLQMIQSKPWLGAGLGTWPVAYPKYAVLDAGVFANQAHNDWLQWAAEGGVPLALLLVGLFCWSLRASLRAPMRCIWGLGVVAVFVHACVDYPFSRPALGAWFMAVLALLAAGERFMLRDLREGQGRAPHRHGHESGEDEIGPGENAEPIHERS